MQFFNFHDKMKKDEACKMAKIKRDPKVVALVQEIAKQFNL